MTDTTLKFKLAWEGKDVDVGLKVTDAMLQKLADGAKKAAAATVAGMEDARKGVTDTSDQVKTLTDNMVGYSKTVTGVFAGGNFNTKTREVETGVKAGTEALGKMEVSAKQTAAALRGVPAQFTDIVTSLQGGQAPLTVLLQQGGQLKDMFGGAGAAARALTNYVLGLVTPLTVVAAVVAALGFAYYQGSQEADGYAKAIVMTGNAAGVTVGKLQVAAANISTAVSASQGKAAEVVSAFVASAGVQADSLEKFAGVAIKWERETGQAIDETVKQFSALEKAPVAASVKLNETTNYLTLSIYKQIKALQDQGRTSEAATLAQNAWADAMEGRSAQLEKNLGLLERGWRAIVGVAKGAWDAMLDVGREDTLETKIQRVQERLATFAQLRAADARGAGLSALDQAEEKRLQGEATALAQKALRIKNVTDAEAERGRTVAANIAFDKMADGYTPKKIKLEQALTEARNTAREAGKSLAETETLLTNIRNDPKFADKAPKKERVVDPATLENMRAYSSVMGQLTDIQSKASGAADGLSKSQIALRDIMASPQWERFNRRKQEEIILAAAGSQAAEDESAARKQLAKAQAEFENVREAELKRSVNEIAAVNNRAQALEDEAAAFGLNRQAVEAMTIARLNERVAVMEGREGSEQLVQLLKQEIAARERLAKAQDELDAKQASAKAAKQAQEDWARAAEKIENSITDALMRGFESGKGFLENLRDTAVNMFKTLVLRPIVSAVVNPVAQNVTGMLLGGNGAAGQAGSGGLGGLTQAKSLYDMFAGGFTSLGESISTTAATMGKWLVDNTTGLLQQAGNKLYAYSGSIGTVGSYAGGALAGYGLGTAISGGRSVFGDGNQDVATLGGTAIGAFFGGPLGAAIGGAVGGVINRAFGQGAKEINASGIQGTFSGSNFSGQSYQEWSRSGGWFNSGSSGTDYSALDGTYANNLGKVYATVTKSTAALAASLGLPTSQILGYVKSIRLDSSQLTEAGITSLFEGIADELARTVVSSEYIREGERATATLTRLTTSLSSVNNAFDLLDKSALSVGLAGGDAASKLVDLFGGTDAFSSATQTYYQAFYSEEERLAKTSEQLAASFALMGVAMPDSLQSYRDLVNAQDVSTESGRQMYAALMGVSGAFAQVTNAATAASASLIKTLNYATYVDYATAASNAGGTPIARFADGGQHAGGLRWVGEEGIELEATGPSRIWNAAQIASAVAGNSGGGSDGSAAELRALREENRAQARTMATLYSRMVKLFDNWDINGMPEVRTV